MISNQVQGIIVKQNQFSYGIIEVTKNVLGKKSNIKNTKLKSVWRSLIKHVKVQNKNLKNLKIIGKYCHSLD